MRCTKASLTPAELMPKYEHTAFSSLTVDLHLYVAVLQFVFILLIIRFESCSDCV